MCRFQRRVLELRLLMEGIIPATLIWVRVAHEQVRIKVGNKPVTSTMPALCQQVAKRTCALCNLIIASLFGECKEQGNTIIVTLRKWCRGVLANVSICELASQLPVFLQFTIKKVIEEEEAALKIHHSCRDQCTTQ